jgi:site-specific recombinase XerC
LATNAITIWPGTGCDIDERNVKIGWERFAQEVTANGNDLVGLAQLLGHESLNTTSRYCKQTEEQLAEASERLTY